MAKDTAMTPDDRALAGALVDAALAYVKEQQPGKALLTTNGFQQKLKNAFFAGAQAALSARTLTAEERERLKWIRRRASDATLVSTALNLSELDWLLSLVAKLAPSEET